jgi:hypothetical protein
MSTSSGSSASTIVSANISPADPPDKRPASIDTLRRSLAATQSTAARAASRFAVAIATRDVVTCERFCVVRTAVRKNRPSAGRDPSTRTMRDVSDASAGLGSESRCARTKYAEASAENNTSRKTIPPNARSDGAVRK